MNRKDVGLRIRVDRGLRESFVEACRVQDVQASQVLRQFMRTFVEKSAGGSQLALPLEKDHKLQSAK
ncbi:plasmid-related protein [Pseudoxanthomonas mexicana]|uniref:plasmid-related protein n=1 Tax=Pseudoxanthomonas mexicana TaxID=128785 RepID=UPI00398AC1D3